MRIPLLKSLLFLSALSAPLPGRADIAWKNAFPGVTFDRPIYFGEIPGMAQTTYAVLEQHTGQVILLTKSGTAWNKTVMLKIDVNQANEQGLLGIAFHPDYTHNRKYYVSYDTPENYNNVISERIADSTLTKDSGVNRVLISIPDKYDNHNGGTIAFGPKDGYLYWGTGDGGNQYDPEGNGQNKNVFLAKMLRIDVDKKDAGKEYAIPADNPFASGGGKGEIFAYGFRNPFKWSFDPLNGDLWVGDVGQDQVEEVDIVTKGANYGWSAMEGPNGTNSGSMILPVFSYTHATGNAVIGGIVYRGNPASKYYGVYFTSDNGTKATWALTKDPAGGKAAVEDLSSPPSALSSFGTDTQGLLYACGLNTGAIYLLDSPDLGPVPVGVHDYAAERLAKRVLSAGPDGRLREEAFGPAQALSLYTSAGERAADIARRDPRIPADLQSGIYLLKAAGADAGKLVVP